MAVKACWPTDHGWPCVTLDRDDCRSGPGEKVIGHFACVSWFFFLCATAIRELIILLRKVRQHDFEGVSAFET